MLNNAFNEGLRDVKVSQRIAELGARPLTGTPTAFARLIAEETEKWAKVVKFSNAKAG
jgi:tripartite-type tricarboxylate transporter receptor subunit TctC